MRRPVAAVALTALLASTAAAGGVASPRAAPAEAFALVRAPTSAATALRAAGARPLSRRLGVWRVRSTSVPRLRARGLIVFAEPDRKRRRLDHVSAGDDLLPAEWWYARVGADRVEPPGPGVPLTIIDSGLDGTHPEFASRPDTELLNTQTVAERSEFHGTAVASVAAAPANGVGLVGTYPRARLLSWDATQDGGVTSADVIDGLDAAIARGRGVVNISLGGERSEIEALAVANAFAGGVVVVAASGNDGEAGSPPQYPASLPHVVSVGATGRDDTPAAFSSRSPALDVAAPGDEIPVAVPPAFTPGGYGLASGTSFASPIVAAALAWAWTARPELDKTQLLELLRRSARDLGTPGRDAATGFGLLDVPALLSTAAPPRDPFEPNDDAGQAGRGTPRFSLTTRARGRSRVLATIDAADDPRDVYPIWVPARRSVTASLRSSGSLALGLATARPPTLTARPARATGLVRLVVTNRAARGRYVLLNVAMVRRASPNHASYTLAVTTGSARR